MEQVWKVLCFPRLQVGAILKLQKDFRWAEIVRLILTKDVQEFDILDLKITKIVEVFLGKKKC